MQWGIHRGPIDEVYPAYQAERGRNRRLMAKIALQPLTVWTGAWYPVNYAQTVAREIVQDTTAGKPNVLSQIAVFRLDPWEVCHGSWSTGDQVSYRAWISQFAAGMGRSRVALILQPDLPFALCAGSSVPTQLVAYAAAKFTALRHTTVYLDVGAAEWASVGQAVSLLEQAGIQHVRGFASTRMKRARATAPMIDCASRFGIPPTTDVANARWGLSTADRAIARQDADAYLWAGRPWVDNNSGSFVLSRALQLAASSPL